MLEMGSLPLENVLGSEIAQIFLQLHRDHGVEFLAETVVESFGGINGVERVVLSNGAIVKSDFVVVGIGVTPRTEPFEAAGLTSITESWSTSISRPRLRTFSLPETSPTPSTRSTETASESSTGPTHRSRA